MVLHLTQNHSFPWKKRNNVWLKVSSTNGDSIDIINPLNLDQKALKRYLNELPVFFSIVSENNDFIFAAVDYHRMFPLFYKIKDNELYLSDSIEYFQENRLDTHSVIEFSLTGYVTGENTLLENVKQIQAGEYLIFNKKTKEIYIEDYVSYRLNGFKEQNVDFQIKKLDSLIQEVFKDLIKSANGRTFVIPLSAGYDSRMIVNMLSRLKYQKVVCFSYGIEDNWESKESKKIAESLGYKWYFVPYDKGKWKKLRDSNIYKDFLINSGKGVSTPHILDFIAVLELKELGLIPDNSVFLPGHTAFLSFSQYPQIQTVKNIKSSLFNKHYILWSLKNFKKQDIEIVKKRLYTNINLLLQKGNNLENAFYLWEKNERHSKFICNSVRTYELLGYQWALPLWDKRLVDFWYSVDHKFRINKELVKVYFHKNLDISSNLKSPNYKSNTTIKRGLRKFIHRNKIVYTNLKQLFRIKEYFSHPMGWYKMFSIKEYLYNLLKGATNINSFIMLEYLDLFKKNSLKDSSFK